jgi:hypothetical protein
MAKLNLAPQVLDLTLYAGDGVEFRLICTDTDKQPVDVSGAVEAQVRLDRTLAGASLEAFAADMADAGDGIIVLSMTGDQTMNLITDDSGKFTGVWDVQLTRTGLEPRTLCQGQVVCLVDVTR